MALYDSLFGFIIFTLLSFVAPQLASPVIGNPVQFQNPAENEVSLYSSSSPVINLNSKNFVNKVLKDGPEKTAFFVNFYSDWCGHCRQFVPTWESLALRIKNWSGLVKIGAVNCALKQHEFLCLANNITAYPSMKYFPRNAHLIMDGIQAYTIFDLAALKRNLVDFIVDDYSRNNYEDWPNFNFLPSTNDVSQLWSYTPHTDQYTHMGLVFQNDYEKYLGAKILLDFSAKKSLKIRRVRYNNPLASVLNVETFPAFVLLGRGENTVLYKAEYGKSLLAEVEKIIYGKDAPTTPSPTPATSPQTTQRTTLSPEQLKSKFVVWETDLLLAARFSLLGAVSSSYLELSGSKLQSLKNFISLYAQYFPPLSRPVQNTLSRFRVVFPERLERSERAKLLFKDLYSFLNNAENKTIKREEWVQEFERLETLHGHPFPTNQDYIHCRGSEKKYRGYSCGLWTVFHALTLNAFYERGFLPNFDPLWILKSIKGYVENFFGCAECATHFVEMTTRSFRMEDFVKNAADVILYMWNAHNIVNKRLAGNSTETEDPSMPKMQFPPDFLCPTCRDTTAPGGWNETAVLQFLSTYYGSGIKAHAENWLLNKFT